MAVPACDQTFRAIGPPVCGQRGEALCRELAAHARLGRVLVRCVLGCVLNCAHRVARIAVPVVLEFWRVLFKDAATALSTDDVVSQTKVLVEHTRALGYPCLAVGALHVARLIRIFSGFHRLHLLDRPFHGSPGDDRLLKRMDADIDFFLDSRDNELPVRLGGEARPCVVFQGRPPGYVIHHEIYTHSCE